jgi:single-strand DNA-binding protein
MGSENSVTVVGTMGRDVDLRYTPSGVAVAKGSLAVSRQYTNRNGEKVEQTDWFNWTAWRQTAENAAETLHKGDRVIITGWLSTRSWETEEGAKRSVTEIEADEIGPSLRWATATIVKATRSGPGEWSAQGPQEEATA